MTTDDDTTWNDDIYWIPLDGSDRVQWGNVGSVIYRDSINGIRYTAHYVPGTGYWITRHNKPADRNDTDGPGTERSILESTDYGLNRKWNALRATQVGPRP